MQKLVLFGLALLLLSCGRDTGSYSYTGVFVDSCGSKPIENAKVVVHVYDIDSTRSAHQGILKSPAIGTKN